MRKLILGVALSCMAIGAALAQQNVVEVRRASYKQMGEIMQAMKAIAENGGDLASLRIRVAWMVQYSRQIPSLFPPGSGPGEGMGETKALPTVWSENPGFVTAAHNLTVQTERLQAAIESGEQAAFVREFQATGAVCAACHRTYRAR